MQDTIGYPGGYLTGMFMERMNAISYPYIGIPGTGPEFLMGYSPLFLNHVFESENVCP